MIVTTTSTTTTFLRRSIIAAGASTNTALSSTDGVVVGDHQPKTTPLVGAAAGMGDVSGRCGISNHHQHRCRLYTTATTTIHNYDTQPNLSNPSLLRTMSCPMGGNNNYSDLMMLQHQQQQPQQRGLANWSGERYKSGGQHPNTSNKKGGGGNNAPNHNKKGGKDDGLKLVMCWSSYELETAYDEDPDMDPDEEEFMFTKTKFDIQDVKRAIRDTFDTDQNIEYFNGTSWMPLKNIQDLAPYRGYKTPVPIRIPEHYEEEDGQDEDDDDESFDDDDDDDFDAARYQDDDEDDDDVGRYLTSSGNLLQLKDLIHILVAVLKSSNMKPQQFIVPSVTLNESSLILEQQQDPENDDTTTADGGAATTSISTKQWIVNQAHADISELHDDKIRKQLDLFLLGQVGALDHIAQWIHTTHVWNYINPPKPPASLLLNDDVYEVDDDDDDDNDDDEDDNVEEERSKNDKKK